MTKLISIVFCSYNRAKLLCQAITPLAQQIKRLGFHCEIIVIDNGSTDSTAEMVGRLKDDYPPINYIHEPVIGLSYARNRGWLEATGKYVAYVDDDCQIPQEWLMRVIEIIEKRKPIVFGGPFLPFYISQKPKWYKDDYGTFMDGRYPKASGNTDHFNLCGGNLIIKRECIQELGGFDPQLGMTGNTIGYAEEDELQDRIRKKWSLNNIYFDPDLVVYHLVSPKKMKLSWRIVQQFQRGKSLAVFFRGKNHDNRFSLLIKWVKTSILIGFSLIRGLLFRNLRQYPYFGNWFYEVTSLYFAHLGAVSKRLSFKQENQAFDNGIK